MKSSVRRIFVEKRKGYDIEAQGLFRDISTNLGIRGLESLRIINRYDVSGVSDEEYAAARNLIFSEPPVDIVHDEIVTLDSDERAFAVEYLPGQYDQRADSAAQCIQMLTHGEKPQMRTARLMVLKGNISDEEFARVKAYCINPVDSREAEMAKPTTLEAFAEYPGDVRTLSGFTVLDTEGLSEMVRKMGLAMSCEDLAFCQAYFRDEEKRDPTITEIRLIDTYWSDHCRHTTFLTNIEKAEFEEGKYRKVIESTYSDYLRSRSFVYQDRDRDICLMDLATIAMKELKKRGKLSDLDASDEINACSIVVKADVNGHEEDWLVMFKNETHNHPTEIEPFGGAATCLGGAIRDPLSGRAYVYQAMRVTGSGDPRTKVSDTIPGKLPQRKITTGAAAGYSSYGNQIGLATGQVAEIYDEGYVAKRMEIGAVIGAAPKANVVRKKPEPGDVIILLGGRTGRDGCGGATGSSKEHNEESLLTCGAEVQKGNPPTERKIQRLFRNPSVSTMIKRCNDFGAGGVSVAVGELAEGLDIDLDAVPKKYEGLDGTELAISESQERMAVVVDKKDERAFIAKAAEENLEATTVAVVTDKGRLTMKWRGKQVVGINRAFLDTNGVKQKTEVKVSAPQPGGFFGSWHDNGLALQDTANAPADTANAPTEAYAPVDKANTEAQWLANLQRLDVCSRKGLVERFDSTIGAGSILMPFGGKYQLSPSEGMAAKLPVLNGDTATGTLMSFGYNPSIARWSPFHGAVYAVVEAVAKIAAMGGDYKKIRMTFQEYFEKPGRDPVKWGKPFSALLGAYHAQIKLGLPAIGGKDSMSGTFKDMTVPPTLVAFAVDTVDAAKVISTEFKAAGNKVVLLELRRTPDDLPDFEELDRNYSRVYELAAEGRIKAAHSIRAGGMAEAVSMMCFGNRLGFEFTQRMDNKELYAPMYGSLILEMDEGTDIENLFGGLKHRLLGNTLPVSEIKVNGSAIILEKAIEKWMEPIEGIFPTRVQQSDEELPFESLYGKVGNTNKCRNEHEGAFLDKARFVNNGINSCGRTSPRLARPRIFIPVFPGTNCEYDTAKAFERAGGLADVMVVKNLTPADIEETLLAMKSRIEQSQIVMLPGGFSAGDEPEGSGKFFATAFRNPYISEAVMELLKRRDGLILGICNGFQALIKLGLVPYGEIRDMEEDSPTLTFNTIGRHVSCMVRTKTVSNLSPWLANVNTGDIHTIAVSHGEGRFVAKREDIESMLSKGQLATQYVDAEGNPTYDIRYNPNGSTFAVEGITSPDGRVFGKMGHSERMGSNVCINVPGEKDQKLFEAGVQYFR